MSQHSTGTGSTTTGTAATTGTTDDLTIEPETTPTGTTTASGMGWLAFSGIMLMLAGVNNIVSGLWAIDRADAIAVQTLLFSDSLAAWGWFYLVAGTVVLIAGIGVMQRAQWARFTGIFVASLAVVANSFWLFTFPIASLVSILLASFVIYGLTVHGEPTTTTTTR